ncbi:hypothetical protein [Chroococcidiopsis sp. SAG 2025]|uniref:hypothetical protein n=1 Tax=Chroococcidiopsis sp. SAG 2025 TaxID=171389 RepID=UPI002936DA9E|nr:hypothetical protein [Chroococcidiopsis sp. SAG 2025]
MHVHNTFGASRRSKKIFVARYDNKDGCFYGEAFPQAAIGIGAGDELARTSGCRLLVFVLSTNVSSKLATASNNIEFYCNL